MLFKITVEESVAKTFEVRGDTAEEALEKAKRLYNNGDLVLDPGDLISKQISITEPISEATEWEEF